jgi:6-phosphogluconate dehydrogenase
LIELSSVSLRDISRFTKLFHWFKENSPKNIDSPVEMDQSDEIDQVERAVILSYIFCYAQRFSTIGER